MTETRLKGTRDHLMAAGKYLYKHWTPNTSCSNQKACSTTDVKASWTFN